MQTTKEHKIYIGNEKVFNEVYQLLYSPLYGFALKFVENEIAQDLIAEVFISLWKNKKQFNSLDEIQKYAFVAVKNRAINSINKQKNIQYNKQLLLKELQEIDEDDMELAMLQNEILTKLYEELNSLPEKMREIFLLSFKDGLKPGEIAKMLHLSVQTVRNQKVNAIKKLRDKLGQDNLLLLLLLLTSHQTIFKV
ncbi:RNA polymerase sigma factor [Sphingobacterium lactis]|uniref:RNA polymerase sigma factor n=1 Tax=Sphingobacterium lactis TaxID=797291 RepID=UPI003F818825